MHRDIQGRQRLDRPKRVPLHSADREQPARVADDRHFRRRVRHIVPPSRRCVRGWMLTGCREISSGGGTVDFQEFVSGLSAFSSRGGREEKLRCACPRLSRTAPFERGVQSSLTT